jgi:hypothetical protein
MDFFVYIYQKAHTNSVKNQTVNSIIIVNAFSSMISANPVVIPFDLLSFRHTFSVRAGSILD